MSFLIRRTFGLIAALTLLYAPWCLGATPVLLEGYDLIPGAESITVRLQFTEPVNFLSHFPQSRGQHVEVMLQPLKPRAVPSRFGTPGKVLQVLEEDKNLAIDVSYTQETDKDGVLSIDFEKVREFTIKPAKNKRHLDIRLVKEKKISSNQRAMNRLAPSRGALVITRVINLKSSTRPIDISAQPQLPGLEMFERYTTTTQLDGKTWYRLRLGFFKSAAAANARLEAVKAHYPEAWVDLIDEAQVDRAKAWFIEHGFQGKAVDSSGNSDKTNQLLERARQAMVAKNYPQAIRIYTHILEGGDTAAHPQALELLGLARERNGQLAHAKAEYESYLARYPEGEGAERVRQRLLGLTTASAMPRDALENNEEQPSEAQWEFFGSLAQFYRRQVNSSDITEDVVTDNSINSDLFVSGRRQGPEYILSTELIANHRYDFIDDEDPADGALYSLYFDVASTDDDINFRLGRQTHSSDGVLGRFDGLLLSKRVAPNRKLNFLAGYPVELNIKDGVRTDRYFYAVSYDLEAVAEKWDLKFFAIDQTVNDVTDRRAVGSEIQYIDDYTSMFALLDFDVSYNELNQATLVGNWRSESNSNLNLVMDYRKSPLLTTTNALLGRTESSVEQLLQTLNEDEIRQLAQDRTAEFKSITVSASTPLGETLQINGDVTASNLEGTPASGGVDATPGTGTEYFYNFSVVSSRLFGETDINIAGLRYTDASTSNTSSLTLSSRFNVDRNLRLNPRLLVEWRDNDDGSKRTTYKPRFIMDYRYSRNLKFEIELAYEKFETDTAGTTQQESDYYIYMGYIYDF